MFCSLTLHSPHSPSPPPLIPAFPPQTPVTSAQIGKKFSSFPYWEEFLNKICFTMVTSGCIYLWHYTSDDNLQPQWSPGLNGLSMTSFTMAQECKAVCTEQREGMTQWLRLRAQALEPEFKAWPLYSWALTPGLGTNLFCDSAFSPGSWV